MLRPRFFLSLFLLLVLPSYIVYGQSPRPENLRYAASDRDRVEEILRTVKPADTDPGMRLLAFALELRGAAYEAHTLEGSRELLVVNVDSLDCTTFVENSLALCRTWTGDEDSFEAFARELELIRYRGGLMQGYVSRLHYFSEWIRDQELKGVGEDLSEELGGIPDDRIVDFMSTHPEAYDRLKNDPELVAQIHEVEKKINGAKRYYIPTSKISGAETGFRNGDVVGICTSIEGLDIMHTGILILQDGDWHLLHASYTELKVVISSQTLKEYLQANSKATGIMLMRAL